MQGTDDIDFLAELIEEREVVFFVGAGVSLWEPSNLPSGRELKENLLLLTTSCDELAAYRQLLGSSNRRPEAARGKSRVWSGILEKPLEWIFGVVHEELGDRAFALLDFMKGKPPNQIHILLAQVLARYGEKGSNNNVIFTTNFDTLLEDALASRLGREDIVKPCYESKQFSMESMEEVRVFKLHGCIEAPSSLITTIRALSRGLEREKAEVLMHYLRNKWICFVGYSASDPDIFPILRDATCRGLIICEREASFAANNNMGQLLGAHGGRLVRGDMRDIFGELSLRLGFSLNFDIDHNDASSEHLAQYSGTIARETKLFAFCKILLGVPYAREALKVLKKTIRLTASADVGRRVKFLHLRGVSQREQGDYNAALRSFRKARDLLLEEPVPRNELFLILRELGDTLNVNYQHELALMEFRRATMSFPRLGLEATDSTLYRDTRALILLNTAMALLYLAEESGSLQSLPEAGDLLAEASRLAIDDMELRANIVRIQARRARLEGRWLDALSGLFEALDLFRYLGKTVGQANVAREIGFVLGKLRYCEAALEWYRTARNASLAAESDTPGVLKAFDGMMQVLRAKKAWGRLLATGSHLTFEALEGVTTGGLSLFYVLRILRLSRRRHL